jgi:D-alanyl-D-alanine carboxypeptidase
MNTTKCLTCNAFVRGAFGLLIVLSGGCSRMNLELPHDTCISSDNVDASHPKAQGLQRKLQQVVAVGVPGIVMALRDASGTWASASGLSKIETKTPMQICHLQFGQSVAKTFMASAILLLYEDGRLDLDDKITAYLPGSVTRKIANAETATVRMLLNHTSGIAEYNDKPNYVTYLLQHPLHTFTTDDYLDYVRGASPKFSPGEKHSYTNTNYLLLALIADEITGDHKKFIQEEILATHDLNNTYYHDPGFMEMPELVNTYWDRYSNGQIENCSEMHRINVASLVGDDGVVATPVDYVSFLEKLLTHQILSPETMSEMLDFVRVDGDSKNGYGLGIHQEFHRDLPEWGHTGGGIGSGCILGYLPHNDTYYFIAINLGTSITPRVAGHVEDIIDEIYDILLE